MNGIQKKMRPPQGLAMWHFTLDQMLRAWCCLHASCVALGLLFLLLSLLHVLTCIFFDVA